MELLQLTVTGKEVAPPLTIDCAHRRLPSVIRAHVDQTRPFMIAVQRRSQINVPLNESWVVRGWKAEPVKSASGEILEHGVTKPWPRKYLALDAVVVVLYLPHGSGGGAGAGSSGKSPLNIAIGIAGLALATFAGPLGAGVAASFFGGSAIAATPAQGRLLVGSTALALLLKSRILAR